jgi:hypothetical protein
MSQKKKLLELYQKVKERANLATDDAELHEYLNELEAEVNSIVEPQSDEEEGGNHPPLPPGAKP